MKTTMIKYILILAVFVGAVFANTYKMMTSLHPDKWAIQFDLLLALLFVAGTIWTVLGMKLRATERRKIVLLKVAATVFLCVLGLSMGFVAYCFVVFGMFKW